MAVVEAVVVLGYACWFVLSVARQAGGLTGRRWGWLRALRLVPRWHLFARPTGHDVTLMQRTVDASGVATDWRPVPVAGPRPAWAWLWHPDLAERMIVLRVAGAVEAGGAPSRGGVPLTDVLAYRALCGRLAAGTRMTARDRLEIALQLSRSHDPGAAPVMVAVSPPHPFCARPDGAVVRAS
jgi:hypothetical protein